MRRNTAGATDPVVVKIRKEGEKHRCHQYFVRQLKGNEKWSQCKCGVHTHGGLCSVSRDARAPLSRGQQREACFVSSSKTDNVAAIIKAHTG